MGGERAFLEAVSPLTSLAEADLRASAARIAARWRVTVILSSQPCADLRACGRHPPADARVHASERDTRMPPGRSRSPCPTLPSLPRYDQAGREPRQASDRRY